MRIQSTIAIIFNITLPITLPRYSRDWSTPLLPTSHPPPYTPSVFKGQVNPPPTNLSPSPLPLPQYTRDRSTPLLPTLVYIRLVNHAPTHLSPSPYPPSVYKGQVNPLLPTFHPPPLPSLGIQGPGQPPSYPPVSL